MCSCCVEGMLVKSVGEMIIHMARMELNAWKTRLTDSVPGNWS